MCMWEFIAFAALVVAIVAVAMVAGSRDKIKTLQTRLNILSERLANIEKLSGKAAKQKTSRPPPKPTEKPSTLVEPLEEERKAAAPPPPTEPTPKIEYETLDTIVRPPEAPAKPLPLEATRQEKRKAAEPTSPTKPAPQIEPEALDAFEPPPQEQPALPRLDREAWARIEEKLGKQWITWVGAVVLFLAAGLFVKYAFDHKWLGPWARVILGVVAGIAVAAAGERFIRRKMRALGQGLIGTGLAILYVSLYAASALYNLLPHAIVFALMALVTIGGMTLAVLHDAIAVSFLAVLGGFLTPVLLSTGKDARDALFSYLVLLDIGVLGVAFFKRWRALDVLAFVGTVALFTGWYIRFHDAPTYSLVPTLLWLIAFYVIFLVQPFVYHLRLATPIVGERFFLAVSNAMGMFAGAYTILHSTHQHTLGFVTIGMSVSYIVLAALTRRRIKTDERAVFGFTALSIALLTIAVPIHLDLHGVTIAWAIKAPLLLYLAYKYDYFPVRIGCLIPLALAAGRIFVIHWPLHSEPFTLILNADFATAIFVALAAGAYAVIHQIQKEHSKPDDRILKITIAIAAGFLALIVMHIEIWQWLQLSAREYAVRWSAALVWVLGAVGFFAAGFKLRSQHSRMCGFVALAIAAALCIWDFALPFSKEFSILLNGRFIASLAVIAVFFACAAAYLRFREMCGPAEELLAVTLFGIGIVLATILFSIESYKWLAFNDRYYTARCLLPFFWTAGTIAALFAGIKLRCLGLRTTSLVLLIFSVSLAVLGYWYAATFDYLLIINARFAAALAPILMVFTYAVVLRKCRDVCDQSEKNTPEILYGIGILLLLILTSWESRIWLIGRDHHYLAKCILPLIWTAGTAGYLFAGLRLRSVALRTTALVVLAVAAGLAARGYWYRIDADYLPFLNWRLIGALAPILMAFVHAAILRRRHDLREPTEKKIPEVLYGIAILLLVILTSWESRTWLIAYDHHYLARCMLPLIWTAGTAGYLFAGVKLRSVGLRTMGLVVLAVAAGFAARGYWYSITADYLPLLNWRFVGALAPVLMAFVYAAVLHRWHDLCEPTEKKIPEALCGIGILLLAILVSWESWVWLIARDYHYLSRCLLPTIWTAAAGVYLAVGMKLRMTNLRTAAAAALFVATMFTAYAYAHDVHSGYYLYLNGRFVVALVLVVTAFGHAYVLRRLPHISTEQELSFAKVLYGIVVVSLFALLNLETYLYFSKTIADPEKARWTTQMALSITWGVYAAAILAVGFWRNVRALRFAALALFGATALKLVLVDMAKVEDIYRIVSFFVLGILMIAASYLYHRVEKIFFAAEKEDKGPD